MRKFITSVTFTRVPKMAFAPMVKTLASVVEKHDPVALHIDGMYQLLLDVMPELDNLQNTYQAQDKTEELNQSLQKRHTLLVAILGQSRMTAKAEVEEEAEHRAVVLPFIHKHLKTILDSTTDEQTGTIDKMFAELEGNEAINVALLALGWKASFQALKTVEARIDHIGALRRIGRAATPEMKTGIVKAVISEALTDLLNRIEMAQKEFKTLDYAPLIKELNTVLTPIGAKIKARDTRSKNAQEAATKAASDSAPSVAV